MKRETPMGPVESDGSTENMYRLFKHGHPKGTVAEFEEWFKELGALQDAVENCPWCGKQPSLTVIPTDFGLKFTVECQTSDCHVNPSLSAQYRLADGAVRLWNAPFHQPLLVKINSDNVTAELLKGCDNGSSCRCSDVRGE